MTERTQRANEALDIQTTLIEGCRVGSDAMAVSGPLLDPTLDDRDVRYGGTILYPGGYDNFPDWIRANTEEATLFTATTDMMMEIQLTMEMLEMEGIEWLPFPKDLLPAETGLMVFPYGMKAEMPPYVNSLETEWYIDGFIWIKTPSEVVEWSAGTYAEHEYDGIWVLPFTRWRGVPTHRPFGVPVGQFGLNPPTVTYSDMTAWKFDVPGDTSTAWETPTDRLESLGLVTDKREPFDLTNPDHVAEVQNVTYQRWFTRSLLWTSFRWLNAEVPVAERASRAQTKRRKRVQSGPTNPETIEGKVLIIDLRKQTKPTGEPGPPRTWHETRWIVGGHKARRRYSIRDANGKAVGPRTGPNAIEGVTYYLDWVDIESYEKGPKSAPLVIHKRVKVLNR